MKSSFHHSRKRDELHISKELFAALGIQPQITDASGERPDFLFRWRNIDYGLEVTRGETQDYQHQLAIDVPGVRNVSTLGQNGIPRNRDELLEEAISNKCSENNPDEDWLDRTTDRIVRKTKNLQKAGYRIRPENWLLIKDSQGPFFPNRGGHYLSMLQQQTHKYTNRKPEFDAVYVHTLDYLFEFRERIWSLKPTRKPR